MFTYYSLNLYSANILLDEHFRAKLVDFGFSAEVSEGKTLFSSARSEGYYPSEITTGQFSAKSDVYTFGVVCNDM